MNREVSKNQPTVLDLARLAKVSVATISRAINPETRNKVAVETLRQIDTLVEKHGFAPNLAAKNLRATRCKTIGILVPHIPNLFVSDYWSKIISGVSNALIDSEYRFKIVALKPYMRKWDQHRFRTAEGIDGLIAGYWPTFFSEHVNLDVPCVFISDPDESVRAHFVCADNERGGEQAAKFLYELGHEKVVLLTGHEWATDSHERVKGFRNFYRRVGTAIPMDMVVRANYEEEDASRAVEKLVLEKRKFTAIFCCNDNMALGALRKLKQLGISCPKSVSVVGFDDEARAAHSDPALTTVRVPTADLGAEAARRLLDHFKGKGNGFFKSKTVLPVSLIERGSACVRR